MASLERILHYVSRKETPSNREKSYVHRIARNIEDNLARIIRRLNLDATVLLQGSIAKDTWLRTHKDLDIFILANPKYSREEFGRKFLEAAKESVAPNPWTERWAQHPYIEAFIHGVRVNIVPCYKVKPGEWLSATDRTPYHTEYITKHIVDEHQKTEVRLLKRFMLGIGVYGADIKTGGFSGYLVELLTLKHGGFLETLKAALSWKNRPIIDIENFYEKNKDEALVLFDEPLIVIDPVDKRRNVSSAVRKEKFHFFRAASNAFLQSPKSQYFYPKRKMFSMSRLRQMLNRRATSILFLEAKHEKIVPDILWGQLYKSSRAIHNLLRQNEFNVFRNGTWSDEATKSILAFELESCQLSPWKKHAGPPVASGGEKKFLKKYSISKTTITGPWLEDGRWFVLVKRKVNDALALLDSQLRDGGVRIGVASRITRGLASEKRILLNEEIMTLAGENKGFQAYLSQFLQGKPTWLD